MVLHKCLAFAKNPEKQTKFEGFSPVGGIFRIFGKFSEKKADSIGFRAYASS